MASPPQADSGDDLLRRIGVPVVVDDHPGAPAGQFHCDGPSDAPGGSVTTATFPSSERFISPAPSAL